MARSAQHLSNAQSAHDMLVAMGAQCHHEKLAAGALRKAMGDTVGTAPSIDSSGSMRNAGAGAVTGPNLMPPVAPKPVSDAEDAKLIQHGHDVMAALGAVCSAEKAAGGPLGKRAQEATALAAMKATRAAPFYGHRPGTR